MERTAEQARVNIKELDARINKFSKILINTPQTYEGKRKLVFIINDYKAQKQDNENTLQALTQKSNTLTPVSNTTPKSPDFSIPLNSPTPSNSKTISIVTKPTLANTPTNSKPYSIQPQVSIQPQTAGINTSEVYGPSNPIYGPDLPASVIKAREDAKLTPETWGIKLSGSSETYYMQLLPAVSSSLGGAGHLDTPNVMPGLNIKFLSAWAKHKLPGFSPVYQRMGVDSIVVTIVGMFTGEDGIPITSAHTKQTAPSSIIEFPTSNKFNTYPHTTEKANVITNQLDSFENLQSFVNFGIINQQELKVEINLRKGGKDSSIKKASQSTSGAIRNSSGNPSFTGIIRSVDTYVRRFDRTYYTITMEVTRGLSAACSSTPLNLTLKLKDQIEKETAKYDQSSCGIVDKPLDENGKPVEVAKITEEDLKDYCYIYSKDSSKESRYKLGKTILTAETSLSATGKILSVTAGPSYTGREAAVFLADTNSTLAEGCIATGKNPTSDYISNYAKYANPVENLSDLQFSNPPKRFESGSKTYQITTKGQVVQTGNLNFTLTSKPIAILTVKEALDAMSKSTDANRLYKEFASSPGLVFDSDVAPITSKSNTTIPKPTATAGSYTK